MAVAHLSEIFGSIQGEGMYAGRPALFLRFAGCNLACSYCDTPDARTCPPACAIREGDAGDEVANPVGCADIARLVGERFSDYRLAVLTGGEPLLQPSAVRSLGEDLKARGLEIHLETNGTLPEALREVRDTLDFVCMDIKLPSTQGGTDLGDLHARFLGGLEDGCGAVKVVVPGEVPDAEVLDAMRLIADVNRKIPVFLQPVFIGARCQVEGARLLHLLAEAARLLDDVRISVQIHKILGIR
jgi:7-carboxy-7-deazaguanine synthase